MNDNSKAIVGVVGAGLVAFVLGVVLMGGSSNNPPPRSEDRPVNEPGAEAPAPPLPAERVAPAAKATEEPAPVVRPAPARVDPPPVQPQAGPKDWDGTWKVKTLWGLPRPRSLTAEEKAGLKMLGSAVDTNTYKFSSITLDDGSRIPGVPPPGEKGIKAIVLGKIQELGLADGFEAAIARLADHNLNHLTVQVTKTPDWTAVRQVAGDPDSQSESEVFLDKPGGRGRERYRMTWYRYGWLEFGVGDDKVRAIRADLTKADIVPAESIPGGRSPPDPDYVAKRLEKEKRKRGPGSPPREVDALKLMGRVVDIRANQRNVVKRDPVIDAVARKAGALVGKDIYPDVLEYALAFKKSPQVDYIILTPSNTPSLKELIDIMDDTNITFDDRTTLPGTTIKWHRYMWLEFGIVDDKVAKIKISTIFVPNLSPAPAAIR